MRLVLQPEYRDVDGMTEQRPRFRYRGVRADSPLAFDKARCDWCGGDYPAGRLPVIELEGNGQSCPACGDVKDRGLEKARRMVPEYLPRGGRLATITQVRAFYAALLRLGGWMEGAIRFECEQPRKAGRPSQIAEPFALGFLFLQGVSDARIGEAISLSADAVKKRRTRSKLFRTEPAMRDYERFVAFRGISDPLTF